MQTLANREFLAEIKEHICYTELVYQRVNKKLEVSLTPVEIEVMVQTVLTNSMSTIKKCGKNYYVTDEHQHIRLTINSLIAANLN